MILFALSSLVLALIPGNTAINLEYKVVGGYQTTIEKYPHQVSLRMNDWHICGGSILDASTILTAAHCVCNIKIYSQLSVRVGSSNNKLGNSIQVRSIKIHPFYDRWSRFNNDVAILKLNENIIYSRTVQPIALQPPGLEVPPGTKAYVSGWGKIYEGSKATPDMLRATEVTVLDHYECARIYAPSQITRAMLCTRNTNKGPCQGDSGGALIANGRLIGIVSWGVKCAQFMYPEVYAKVSNLYYWIIYNK